MVREGIGIASSLAHPRSWLKLKGSMEAKAAS